jgi:serine/threonine protein kinase HipA of HipAB toxin-antitoxin module
MAFEHAVLEDVEEPVGVLVIGVERRERPRELVQRRVGRDEQGTSFTILKLLEQATQDQAGDVGGAGIEPKERPNERRLDGLRHGRETVGLVGHAEDSGHRFARGF